MRMMSICLLSGLKRALITKYLWTPNVQQKLAPSFRNYGVPPQQTLMHQFYLHVSQNAGVTAALPSNSLKTRNVQNIFATLDCAFISPSRHITSSEEYRKAMEQFRIILNEESIAKDDLIKIVFYTGMQKKSKQATTLTNLALKRLQNNITQLNLIDTCILASTVFKCSVLVKSPFPALFSRQMTENMQYLLDNPRDLCVLVKVLRQQRYHDRKLLDELSKNYERWSKKNLEKCHVLSYFAEAKFATDEIYKVIETSIKELETDYRSKDIAKVLWVASTLGYKIPSDLLPTVWSAINGKIEEFLSRPDQLLNCLLSMALIGHYHEDLTAIVSSPKAISHYKQLGFNINWMRLYQLLDFRKIECGHESNYTGPAFPHPSMQSQMEYRPMLKKIHNFVKYLESKLELSQTSVCFNVNSVNIAGITICRNGRSIHIEVLDPFVCLDNSSRPVGFMECKIRLLEKMKSTYLLVDQEHLNKGEEKLFAWMEDEIVRLYMIQ